jgi:hypothetical protein
LDSYWLDIILKYNNDIKYENINDEYEKIRLLSNYTCNNKIIFKNKLVPVTYKKKLNIPKENMNDISKDKIIPKDNINKIIPKDINDCSCTINELCITNNLNEFKKCKNFNNFLNNNPILELLFKKKKIDICYIPNMNVLVGEYKKEIINNIRFHMEFINAVNYEYKIVFVISMYNCLIQNYHLIKNNNSLLKASLEKLYELDNNKFSLQNILKKYDIDKNVINNFINVFTKY